MDTLTFNSNTYSGTYTTGNNGVPCTFTVVVGTLSPTVGDNLTLARINNRNVYIQDSANNNQYIVTDFSATGTYTDGGVRLEKNQPKQLSRGTVIYLGGSKQNAFRLN